MPVIPAIARRAAASSGLSESRKRAAMAMSEESSVMLTVSLALDSRAWKLGNASLASAARAAWCGSRASIAGAIRPMMRVRISSGTCVAGRGGPGGILDTAIGEIQLLAGYAQGLEQLLSCLESLPLALRVPAVHAERGDQQRRGQCPRRPAIQCRARALPPQVLAPDARLHPRGEPRCRFHRPQGLAQLAFQIGIHGRGSLLTGSASRPDTPPRRTCRRGARAGSRASA